MASRILFLGTGGDTYVISKHLRSCGGIILQSEGVQVHIDPGPGTFAAAAEHEVNLRETTAMIVTSSDLKHCNDVNCVIEAMTYEGLDPRGVLISNTEVIKGSDVIPPVLSPRHKKYLERFIITAPLKRMGIEHLDLFSLPTKTRSESTFGIKIHTPDFCMVYTSDTTYSKEVAKYYHKADIIIFNCLLPAQVHSKYNLCSADVIKTLKVVKPKLALITFFGKKMLEADPLLEARQISQESKIQTIACQDGMSINPVTYAAKTKQKTLGSF